MEPGLVNAETTEEHYIKESFKGHKQQPLWEAHRLDSYEPIFQSNGNGSSKQDEQENGVHDMVPKSNHRIEVSQEQIPGETRGRSDFQKVTGNKKKEAGNSPNPRNWAADRVPGESKEDGELRILL